MVVVTGKEADRGQSIVNIVNSWLLMILLEPLDQTHLNLLSSTWTLQFHGTLVSNEFLPLAPSWPLAGSHLPLEVESWKDDFSPNIKERKSEVQVTNKKDFFL